MLVREKHELERQLLSMAQQAANAADDETILKLKRDLKRTKALLKDAHSQLERARSETPSKVLLRQLKNQVTPLIRAPVPLSSATNVRICIALWQRR